MIIKLFIAVVAVLVFGLVSLVASVFVFFKYLHHPRYSSIYIGEEVALEKAVDDSLQFPMTDFVSALGNMMLRKQFKVALDVPQLDIQKPLNKYMKRFPHHFLPHAVCGYLHHMNNEEKKAKELFEYAHRVAKDYPKENQPFLDLLPTKSQFFGLSVAPWPCEIEEIVEDTIWTITGPFFAYENDHTPIDVQATLVKLKDQGEDLVLINPLQFSKQSNANEIIHTINSHGNVVAVITTSTQQGGEGIFDSHNIWPNAKLFGCDSETKHGRPALPWCSFLSDSQMFQPDLVHYQMHSQNWKETFFYHPSSCTLLGLTELGISPLYEYKSWSMVLYCLSYGMWRGNDYTTTISLQNYQTVLINDWELFAKHWDHMLSLGAECVIFGHGGVLRQSSSEEVSSLLRISHSWLLDAEYSLSMFEKIHYPPSWIFRNGVLSLLLQIAWMKYKT